MKQSPFLTRWPATIVTLTVVALLASLTSTAQIVKLDVMNFCPRVGNELEISYSILTDTLEVTTIVDFKEQMKRERAKVLGIGKLDFTNFIKDTGDHVFGPFSFNVDGHTVQSGTISIHFDNALPDVNDGIWMRQLHFKGEQYLVIEQRIPGNWNTRQTSKTSTSSTFQTETDDYAEIDENKTDPNTIYFQTDYSQTGSEEVIVNGKEETVGHKISFFKIRKNVSFKAPFKLNKSNLKNLPASQSNFEFLIQ